jgi:hypothetical protein
VADRARDDLLYGGPTPREASGIIFGSEIANQSGYLAMGMKQGKRFF